MVHASAYAHAKGGGGGHMGGTLMPIGLLHVCIHNCVHHKREGEEARPSKNKELQIDLGG